MVQNICNRSLNNLVLYTTYSQRTFLPSSFVYPDPSYVGCFISPVSQPIVQVADVEPEVEDPLAGCKTTGGCTAAQLAQNDLAEWNADLAAALSGGSGSISLTGGIYTISVSWDDNRDGLVDVNDPGLQVSFQP